MAYSSTKKKSAGIVQISIGILTVILVVLIIAMMMIVSSIQGTARIVNYAGLVRGKTQRIVKLEISGKQEDDMIQEIESFIDGLMNGNKELNLVRLEDSDFQTKMEELNEYFLMLEQEIMQVRAYGADKTQILSKSEHFFEICDEATGLAEVYSQRKASLLSVFEKYITADIVVLMLLIGYEFIKAVRYAAMNRVLQKKVYIDGATGLPNRNKCDELLSQPDAAPEDIGVCSFDLNNLRIINNSMGHEAGDEYIRRFAVCLRASMPAEQFVGRAGGDEFIAVTHGMGNEEMKACLASVREQMAEESKSYPDIVILLIQGGAEVSRVTVQHAACQVHLHGDHLVLLRHIGVKAREVEGNDGGHSRKTHREGAQARQAVFPGLHIEVEDDLQDHMAEHRPAGKAKDGPQGV